MRRFAGGRVSQGRPACDTASQMDMTFTLAVGAAFLALAVFAGWRGARPPNPHKGPRLMPWRFIMLLAAACVVPMIVHAVNLMGFTTGRPAP
jgi:hypothetical protein